MTSRPPPQCLSCRHWISPIGQVGEAAQVCAAFPDGIPEQIWWNNADHRKPFPGDHGVRWAALDGAEFPEWALQESPA